jgi:hypothetical protein
MLTDMQGSAKKKTVRVKESGEMARWHTDIHVHNSTAGVMRCAPVSGGKRGFWLVLHWLLLLESWRSPAPQPPEKKSYILPNVKTLMNGHQLTFLRFHTIVHTE